MNRWPRIHKLKILPEQYNAICKSNAKLRVGKNDRKYQIGDLFILKEFEDGEYTGREVGLFPIISMIRDCPEFEIKEMYCIFEL